jgi:hypothetical protein
MKVATPMQRCRCGNEAPEGSFEGMCVYCDGGGEGENPRPEPTKETHSPPTPTPKVVKKDPKDDRCRYGFTIFSEGHRWTCRGCDTHSIGPMSWSRGGGF